MKLKELLSEKRGMSVVATIILSIVLLVAVLFVVLLSYKTGFNFGDIIDYVKNLFRFGNIRA